MQEYTTYINSIIENYFTILSNKGQISRCKTNKLLVLLFIQELFETFHWYITENDYKTILNVINCMNDCLIKLPTYSHFEDDIHYIEHLDDITRITEDSSIRTTEDDMIRRIE